MFLQKIRRQFKVTYHPKESIKIVFKLLKTKQICVSNKFVIYLESILNKKQANGLPTKNPIKINGAIK